MLATAVTVADTLRRPEMNLSWLQAQAFLAGRLDVPFAVVDGTNVDDVAELGGRFYIPFPHLPALVLLPFVALRASPNTALLVALALAFACDRLLRGIFAALAATPEQSRWLRVAFLAGTGFWLMVLWSRGVWYLATVLGVTFTLAAMREVLTRGRAWLVGVLAGLAFLSRQMTVYSLLFLLPALWTHARRTRRGERLLSAALALAAFGALAATYPAFNALRFGSPWETGYRYVHHARHLAARVAEHGLFSLSYVPANLVELFLQGPHVVFGGRDLLRMQGPDPFGTSLTFASPFLFLAFFAPGRRPEVRWAFLSAGLCLVHQLLYHTQGWVQWNTQRYTLDFIPLLLVPVALALRQVEPRVWKATIAYAIALNFLMLFVLPNLHRLLR